MGIKSVVALILFAMSLHAVDSVDSLLVDLGQKADLSEKTKQESVGHVSVYTRQDIDRMQIRSLKELLDFLPFMRYNEDNNGVVSPFFSNYQPNRSSFLRLFIDDREVASAYYGSGIQLFGQVNMSYIDHIEVYAGVPSYRFGIEGAVMVIRMYTKNPERESTNLIGVLGGTYGTTELYGYSAQAFDDLSYLLHVNRRDLHRESLRHNGSSLDRDMTNTGIYAKFDVGNHHFDMQGIKGKKDNFMGNSAEITPSNSNVAYDYLYGGWYYTSDEQLNLSTNVTQTGTKVHDKTTGVTDILGINFFEAPTIIPGFPPTIIPQFFKEQRFETEEVLSDIHLSKTWEIGEHSFLAGLRGRYKSFKIKDFTLDGTTYDFGGAYDRDFITSMYAEGTYVVNEKNLLVASLKIDDYARNGGIRDERLWGGRIGYIYNDKNFTAKVFAFGGEFAPEPYLIAANIAASNSPLINPLPLKKEKATSVSTEFTYRHGKHTTSLALGRSLYEDSVVYDLASLSYKNMNGDLRFDTFEVKNSYQIDVLNRLDTQIWLNNARTTIDGNSRYDLYMGGYVSLLNTVGKWDFANSLIFYGLDYSDGVDDDPGYNYNVAVTYRHDRQLSFFIKGNNLLGEALKSDYYRINPMTGNTTTRVNNVNVYDRVVWFGVEYQF